MNSNTATGRLVGEELLVGGVHLSEVGHVSQEDLLPSVLNHQQSASATYVDLDDLGDAGAGSGNDGLDVVAAGLGQLADVALDEVGGGISGDLAGDEDLAVGADGLGLFGLSVSSFFLRFMSIGGGSHVWRRETRDMAGAPEQPLEVGMWWKPMGSTRAVL